MTNSVDANEKTVQYLGPGNFQTVSIICEGSNKIKTNGFLLSSFSPWLHSLIMEQIYQEDITIICPDINFENIINLLKLVENVISKNTLLALTHQNPEAVLPFSKLFNLTTKAEKVSENNKCIRKDLQESNKVELENPNDGDQHIKEDILDLSQLKHEKCEKENRNVIIQSEPTTKFKTIIKFDPSKNINKTFFECTKCSKTYQYYTKFTYHLETHDIIKHALAESENSGELSQKGDTKLTIEDSKICRFCGEQFKYSTKPELSLYFKHVQRHKLDRFSCNCQETWVKKSQKKRHMQVVHLGYIPCTMCSLNFRRQEWLTHHLELYHNKESKVNKVSKVKNNVNTEDQEQVCDICGKSYGTKIKLHDHKRGVHKPSKFCSICNRDVRRLCAHMRRAHPEQKDKKHVCDLCGKAFVEKGNLQNHAMNVHIKSRPYNCRYGCSFAYNDRGNRNQHEKKKHGGLYQGNENADSQI